MKSFKFFHFLFLVHICVTSSVIALRMVGDTLYENSSGTKISCRFAITWRYVVNWIISSLSVNSSYNAERFSCAEIDYYYEDAASNIWLLLLKYSKKVKARGADTLLSFKDN